MNGVVGADINMAAIVMRNICSLWMYVSVCMRN